MKTQTTFLALIVLVMGAASKLPLQAVVLMPADQPATNRVISEDVTELVKSIRKAAELNFAPAQYALGLCYYEGEGVAKDLVEAVKWFRKAAEQDYVRAQYNLGVCCYNGRGVAKDEVEAVKWYRKAAELNYAPAQYNLGACYESGQGVAKDLVEAVKWFRKAAELNFAPAQYALGLCYYNGQGVAKDLVEAVEWYRKAAEQNDAMAQFGLGVCYYNGRGVAKDLEEAVKWYRKAADQNNASAQFNLGVCFANGQGVVKDEAEAVKWYRKAAEQNCAPAQCNFGLCYYNGRGVTKDLVEAVKWLCKAAEQNNAMSQFVLGCCYYNARGVAKDEVEAYKWWLLAAAQGYEDAKGNMAVSEQQLTQGQIAEGQKLARDFKPHKAPERSFSFSVSEAASAKPTATGTGFFITEDGFLITNNHVVEGANQVRLIMGAGLASAKVVRVDAANDLALLKTDGKFSPLPVVASRGVKLGGIVATVGFPNVWLQGFAPKLAKGEIASLSGLRDDARYFQISVPVQPGNSGGALVDERGNVVGMVSGKLGVKAALAASGSLPENVNYAVKSSFLLGFLESVPEVSAKLKEPELKERKFEDVVQAAQDAAVLIMVY